MIKDSSISGYFSVDIDLFYEDKQTEYYIDELEIDVNILPNIIVETLNKLSKQQGEIRHTVSMKFNIFGEFPYDDGVDELVLYGVPEIESIFSWNDFNKPNGGSIDIDADELEEEFVAVLTDLAITYGDDDAFLTNMLEN